MTSLLFSAFDKNVCLLKNRALVVHIVYHAYFFAHFISQNELIHLSISCPPIRTCFNFITVSIKVVSVS